MSEKVHFPVSFLCIYNCDHQVLFSYMNSVSSAAVPGKFIMVAITIDFYVSCVCFFLFTRPTTTSKCLKHARSHAWTESSFAEKRSSARLSSNASTRISCSLASGPTSRGILTTADFIAHIIMSSLKMLSIAHAFASLVRMRMQSYSSHYRRLAARARLCARWRFARPRSSIKERKSLTVTHSLSPP